MSPSPWHQLWPAKQMREVNFFALATIAFSRDPIVNSSQSCRGCFNWKRNCGGVFSQKRSGKTEARSSSHVNICQSDFSVAPIRMLLPSSWLSPDWHRWALHPDEVTFGIVTRCLSIVLHLQLDTRKTVSHQKSSHNILSHVMIPLTFDLLCYADCPSVVSPSWERKYINVCHAVNLQGL